MAKHRVGLHKEVSTIFDGVWNPETDNIQQFVGRPIASSATSVYPRPINADNEANDPKFATIVKVFKQAPGHIFSSRARREKKRLLSISKHLLINNMPG